MQFINTTTPKLINNLIKQSTIEEIKYIFPKINWNNYANELPHYDEEHIFFTAVREAELEIVKELLQAGVDMNYCDMFNGKNSFFIATEKGNLSMMTFLKEHGINVFQKDFKGRNSLFYAKVDVVLDAMIKIFQFDVNEQDSFFTSVLMHFVRINDEKMVKCLIENEVDVNARDLVGDNALKYAIAQENIQIVKILLNCGAIIDQEDTIESELMSSVVRENFEIFDLLLEYGANIQFTSDNENVFTYAVATGNLDLVIYVLENGCCANTNANFNDWPFQKNDMIEEIEQRIMILTQVKQELDKIFIHGDRYLSQIIFDFSYTIDNLKGAKNI